MEVKVFQFNPVSENTYIVYDDTKQCVVIDPGCFFPGERKETLSFIKDNGLEVKHLINTHMHFDHIFGSAFLEEQFGLKTEAHRGDEPFIQQLPAQLQMYGFNPDDAKAPQIGVFLEEGDIVTFGNQKLQAIHVPGHSPGSLVFYNKEAGCLFSGDVLFEESIGRTDLPSGDHNLLIEGIKTKLLVLPDNTIVYSGHGEPTTIGAEKQFNSFLK